MQNCSILKRITWALGDQFYGENVEAVNSVIILFKSEGKCRLKIIISVMACFLGLGGFVSQAVQAETIDPRCQKLMPHASVTMDFTEPTVRELTTQSKDEVKRLAKKSQFPNQTVYGLTRGKPEVQYEVNRARINLRGGKVCIVPRVTVKAGFSDMTVYLAHELLKSPCKLNLIRAHEMEHVNTWRAHLKGGMRLMQKPLQAKFSIPRLYDSAQAADADLRDWIVGTIDPMMQQLFQNITKAQMEIDSPMSYQLVLEELKACPI